MKILFLIPYPLKQAPSQRFRFEQYLGLLRERGFTVSCQSFWDEQTWSILYRPNYKIRKIIGFANGVFRRTARLFSLSQIDFVFIHRECLPIGPPVIEWIIAKILKKKIIYDFDDAIWLPNTSPENKLISGLKWHSKVKSICAWSYRVSAGNDYLHDFAKQFSKSVIVNPTTVDTEKLHNPSLYQKKTNEKVVIGWTGTHSTLPYLNELMPVLIEVNKKIPDRFKLIVIADRPPLFKFPFLEFIPWTKEDEINDLMQFDIGVMPLAYDEWAKGKCGFKALQYMALQIPTIASPVGVNRQIIQHGENGFLCRNNQEWEQQLIALIENEDLRFSIGIAGRKTIVDRYSVSSNSRDFLNLFS